jgi:hypothetical protein
MSGGLARGIHCNECLQGKVTGCLRQITNLKVPTAMRSVEDLKAHPHTSYANVYTERHLNQIIARTYRQCQKKAARVDNMMAGGSEQCTMCLQSMLRRGLRTPAPFLIIIAETDSSSILPCRQCNKTNRLCAHCGQYASKLHIHGLPTSDLSGSPTTSSATITQNIPVDTSLRSFISLQSPQSSINVRSSANPLPSPIPSPVPSAISNPSHRSASLYPSCSIQPPWDRSYNENEPYIIDGGFEYPLQQGQDVPHSRSFSDPTVGLPRSRTPLGSPQPYLGGPPHSRPVQHPRPVKPGMIPPLASPSSSPQPNPSGSPYRAPTQPSQPMQQLRPASPIPAISLWPDSCRPFSSTHGQPPQPRQSSHPAAPSPPTSHQPAPTRPSHNKLAQSSYPSQSPQPAYPSQSPQPAYPSQSPQPAYPSQSPQPTYPSQGTQPAYPTQPTSSKQNLTDAFPSMPTRPPHPTQHPQSLAPTIPDILGTPPVQRLSSAPQVLISTPEHPQKAEAIPQQKRHKMAGLKKAYDITQKNAATRFVTRVAAKTAFSAVSNVIGADIGGVVDAAGGLNLGGTGIDVGSLVGKAVTTTADAAFDEALGDDDRARHSGGRWKTINPSMMGRQGFRFGGGGGGGGVNQDHITQT